MARCQAHTAGSRSAFLGPGWAAAEAWLCTVRMVAAPCTFASWDHRRWGWHRCSLGLPPSIRQTRPRWLHTQGTATPQGRLCSRNEHQGQEGRDSAWQTSVQCAPLFLLMAHLPGRLAKSTSPTALPGSCPYNPAPCTYLCWGHKRWGSRTRSPGLPLSIRPSHPR